MKIETHGGHLIVRHVPYVNKSKEVRFGVLVTELTLSKFLFKLESRVHM
jgi:hypothetical protein